MYWHPIQTVGVLSLSSLLVFSSAAMAAASKADFERDRTSILAMAGTYRVTFDMRETISYSPDYKIMPPKTSHGSEVVLVANDAGNAISLLHILVINRDGDPPLVLKHWRQDWSYEPKSVLTYDGHDRWSEKPVSDQERHGTWSQTVWGTEDAPRYGAVGHWRYEGGVARWAGYDTARPLARRDSERERPFDRYLGMNRHTITPTGWVQEEDNDKVGEKAGALTAFAHEFVVNTYERSADVANAPAENYWARTKDFWTDVRTAWARVLDRNRGVIIIGERPKDNPGVTMTLLDLADDVADGTITLPAAVAKIDTIIAASISGAP